MKYQIVAALFAVGTTASGVIKHDLHRRAGVQRASSSASSNNAVDTRLNFHTDWLDQGGYFITIEVGTPPQTFEVLVDTGSSDLFIPSADAANCRLGNCPGGEFTAADSSTYSLRSSAPVFNISYADTSQVVGNYSVDTVGVGSATLKNQVFGLADDIQVSPQAIDANGNAIGAQYGIMGVSYVSRETALGQGINFTYATVPVALRQQGYIGSASYSLYLDDIEADNGHMIFGGIDSAKYHGELATLDVLKETRGQEQVVVGSGFSVSYKGQKKAIQSQKYVANLDSGTAGWQIPQSVFKQILDLWTDIANAGVTYNSSVILPCSYINTDASITIGLTGANNVSTEIEVPLGNMLVPALESETTGDYNDTKPLIINGTEQCLFTPSAAPDNSTEFLVGDPFFRSAYAFFNTDAGTISLAPASYNANESNIVPVGAASAPSSYPSGSGSEEPLPTYTPVDGNGSGGPDASFAVANSVRNSAAVALLGLGAAFALM